MAIEAVRRLQSYRDQNGISQSKLAKEIGVVSSTVSTWLNGVNEPSEESIRKIEDFLAKKTQVVLFKESKIPNPIENNKSDKFGPTKNHEGYSDPTATAAIKAVTSKYTDPLPGEIWLNRRDSGKCLKKLIFSVVNNRAMCVTLFQYTGEPLMFFEKKIKSKNGVSYKAAIDYIEMESLKNMEHRWDGIDEKVLNSLREDIAKSLGLEMKTIEVEKEAIKEVPVEIEKIVEKEVPSDSRELELARMRAEIYEDAFTKVCMALGGKI